MTNIFKMVREKSLPKMKAYHTDLLVHDRDDIKKYKGVPFIHITREFGTHIVFLWPANSSAWPKKDEKIVDVFGYAIKHCKEQQNAVLVLFFDGEKLIEIDIEKAGEVVAEHQKNILWQWNS